MQKVESSIIFMVGPCRGRKIKLVPAERQRLVVNYLKEGAFRSNGTYQRSPFSELGQFLIPGEQHRDIAGKAPA